MLTGVAFILSIIRTNVVTLAVQVVLCDKSLCLSQVSKVLAELFRNVLLQLDPRSNMFNTLRNLTWSGNMR